MAANSASTTKNQKSNGKKQENGKQTKTKTSSILPKQEPTEEDDLTPVTRKRSQSPGIRLIGRRIYDSVHGKTCHQCRQKTMDFSVTCTNQINGKQCTIRLCHICLFNRYGESAEEAAALGDWKCPKCRDICNCSFCMKRRGCCPTGTLSRSAKENGFSDMLNVKGSEMIKKCKESSSKKRAAASEEKGQEASVVMTKRRKKNGVDGKTDVQLKSELLESCSGVEKNVNLKRNKSNSLKKSEKIVRSVRTSSKKQAASSKEPVIGSSHVKDKGFEAIKDTKSRLKSSIMKKPDNKKITCKKKTEKPMKVDKNGSASPYNANTKKNGEMCRKAYGTPLKMMDSEEVVPEKIVKIKGKEEVVSNNIDLKDASLKIDIPLPKGTELTKLAGIEMPPEDIGNALQFLEFCEAFGQVLDLKKGQPECLLQEIASHSNSCQTHDQSVEKFHVKLLSIIQENSGNSYASMKTEGRNLWIDAHSKFISELLSPSKGLLLGGSSFGPNEYKVLTTSEKLRLLNVLCDEALGTAKLRSWIEKQNSEEMKVAKEKLIAEKVKEKCMKKKLQDEVAKAILVRNGAPLTISEHENLVSKIKAEAAQTLSETLEASETAIKKRQTDALRSEPVLAENSRKFWKLKSYSDKLGVLVQDVSNGDLITLQEKWFAYNVEEITMVEKYFSLPRKQNTHEACPSFAMVKQEVV